MDSNVTDQFDISKRQLIKGIGGGVLVGGLTQTASGQQVKQGHQFVVTAEEAACESLRVSYTSGKGVSLRIDVLGPTEKSFTLKPRETKTLSAVPGVYTVNAYFQKPIPEEAQGQTITVVGTPVAIGACPEEAGVSVTTTCTHIDGVDYYTFRFYNDTDEIVTAGWSAFSGEQLVETVTSSEIHPGTSVGLVRNKPYFEFTEVTHLTFSALGVASRSSIAVEPPRMDFPADFPC